MMDAMEGDSLVELMMLVEGVREEQRSEIEQMGWVLVAHLYRHCMIAR